jgi:hypothetical protein
MGNGIGLWKITPGGSSKFIRSKMDPEPLSLDDGTRRIPSGGYTTLRTYRDHLVIC